MVFRIRSALRFSLNSANAGLRAFSDGTLRKPLVVEKPNTKVEIQTPARLKESILIVFFKSTIHTKHYRLIQHSSRIRQGLVLNDVLSLTHVRVYFSQSKVPSIEKGQKVVFCVPQNNAVRFKLHQNGVRRHVRQTLIRQQLQDNGWIHHSGSGSTCVALLLVVLPTNKTNNVVRSTALYILSDVPDSVLPC